MKVKETRYVVRKKATGEFYEVGNHGFTPHLIRARLYRTLKGAWDGFDLDPDDYEILQISVSYQIEDVLDPSEMFKNELEEFWVLHHDAVDDLEGMSERNWRRYRLLGNILEHHNLIDDSTTIK